MPRLPDADRRFPLVFPHGTEHRDVVQISAVIDHPNWTVGRHTYANNFDPPPLRTTRWRASPPIPSPPSTRLLEIAWWDWETERIQRHIDVIASGDIAALSRAAPDQKPA